MPAKKLKPRKSNDVPATKGMLYKVRDQLDAKWDARFHDLKSEIHGVKSEIQSIKSEVHRLALLIEEQNARNVFVLDGLTNFFARQEKLEAKGRA